MSIGILSIFMIEIIVKIFAFRLDFFKSKMEVFDAIIVIVSFILDVYFASEEGIESAGGLLIIFRLWRVTRILNGKSGLLQLAVLGILFSTLMKSYLFCGSNLKELTGNLITCNNMLIFCVENTTNGSWILCL